MQSVSMGEDGRLLGTLRLRFDSRFAMNTYESQRSGCDIEANHEARKSDISRFSGREFLI